jgi:S1-C subfamily serine protease
LRLLSGFPPAIPAADPKTLEVGQDVITVGFGLNITGEPSVNRGIISGLNRSLEGVFSGLVQTDAAINHGNSGGPMLNLRGEVVGVNTYTSESKIKAGTDLSTIKNKAVSVTTPYGVFYARSIATALPFAKLLIEQGHVPRASLGIKRMRTVSDIDADYAFGTQGGVQILEFEPKSPAEAAGLHVGDIISQIYSCISRDSI